MSAAVIVTTTPNIEGKKITSYRGVVTGEAIMGANIFKDLFAGVRDIVGGRSATYEKELRRARDIAMEELKTAASEIGANAVVAVDIDYETVGGQGSVAVLGPDCLGRPLRFKNDPAPALPVNFPASMMTLPRERTVSVTPVTCRPSYGL